MFCVLDIESTGGAYGSEAIMEIALFRYDGEEVVDQLISLVHPHKKVQSFVSRMTGITEKMLMRAPRFHELAKRIIELTDGAVLVGHNVEFDYRMLRQEFNRLGYPFEIRTLDTINLAQQLLPELTTYGLDSVCRELGIYNSQVHRAEGDARATLELFRLLQEKDSEKKISIMGQSVLENTVVSDKIQDLKRSVKTGRGVFYLHDKNGKLLFLNFSLNIKQELNRLFIADNDEARKLRDETHSIKCEATGNWLIAKIKLLEETVQAMPKYGIQPHLNFEQSLTLDKTKNALNFGLVPLNKAVPANQLFKVTDRRTGLKAIRLHRRISKQEKRESILEDLLNFPDQALYRGRGRKPEERCVFIVKQCQWVGYFYYTLNDQISDDERLQKTLCPISMKEEYTNLLKLGIFTGEFEKIESIKNYSPD